MPRFVPDFLKRIKERVQNEVPSTPFPSVPGADENDDFGGPEDVDPSMRQRIQQWIQKKLPGRKPLAPAIPDDGPLDREQKLYRIRLAGRMKMLLYIKYAGSMGRFVEPYSLRNRAKDPKDNPLFYGACRAHGNEIHAFKLDKIETIIVTDEPYRPRFQVEF